MWIFPMVGGFMLGLVFGQKGAQGGTSVGARRPGAPASLASQGQALGGAVLVRDPYPRRNPNPYRP
jgi:hypothetical protein